MQVAVLGSPRSWYLEDLRRAAAGKHEILSVDFRDLESRIGQDGCRIMAGGIDLSAVDCVLVRTMPPGTLEQVVFRMDALLRLESAGQAVVNPARVVETAVDKYLASAKLQAAGLHTARTVVCQTIENAATAFDALGGDVVLKPLFGAEGRGITRISDRELMLRAAKTLAGIGAVFYLQEFIPHDGYDLRVLVIGECTLAMRRRNGADWRTNVSRGATTEAVDLSDELIGMARNAAAAIGAELAGVDLLIGRDGTEYIMEVNGVPGWKALARTLDVDVAKMVLDYLQRRVLQRECGA